MYFRKLLLCLFIVFGVSSNFSLNTFDGFAGNVDLSDLLQNMDGQIRQAKEQALSRRDILDRTEKWKFAAEEEKWLDEYERVDGLF